MMKAVFATGVLWLLGNGLLLAQDDKYDIGLQLFPNYSMGVIVNDGTVPTSNVNIARDGETWKPSISLNLFVEYRLSERIELGLGFGYQNHSSKTKKMESRYAEAPIDDNLTRTHFRAVYNHHNLEIPLYAKYTFARHYYVLLGASGLYNFSNRDTLVEYFEDRSKNRRTAENTSTDFRSFRGSGNFGIGRDFVLNEKFSCFVQPYVQYGIPGNSKTAALNRHFLSLGIVTGLRM